MKYIKQIFTCATLAMACYTAQPVMAQVKLSSDAFPTIVAPHRQAISYRERTLCFDITANVEFTATPNVDWITIDKAADGTVYIHVAENPNEFKRSGSVVFANEDKGLSETFTITQGRNEGLSDLPSNSIYSLFTDASLSELKEGVTLKDINAKIDKPYYRELASQILDGTYNKNKI